MKKSRFSPETGVRLASGGDKFGSWSRSRRVRSSLGGLTDLLGLAGRATVESGTSQTLLVETPGVTAAACRLADNRQGVWCRPATPGAVTVHRGDGPVHVVCEKEGYETTAVTVEEEFAAATLGNVILGGAVGIFVDAVSGAAQRYPDKLVGWMKPTQFASPEDAAAREAAKKAYEESAAAAAAHRAEPPPTNRTPGLASRRRPGAPADPPAPPATPAPSHPARLAYTSTRHALFSSRSSHLAELHPSTCSLFFRARSHDLTPFFVRAEN
ncbi:MAG: hypothetical protein KatS3mg117_2755 [Geminicoccaceae bacterium]|nr:MAG: hypothetical protein KatS3mg117_2755 [Geminicoccaceae bacterium]